MNAVVIISVHPTLIRQTFSAGLVAERPVMRTSLDAVAVMELADVAMYAAMNARRDRTITARVHD